MTRPDLSKVQEREQLHSLHAAQCVVEARRRDKNREKELKRSGFKKAVIERKPQPAYAPISNHPKVSMVPITRPIAPFLKEKPVRSKPYLMCVAGLNCISCGWVGASQAAHPNSLAAGGSMGGKACDLLTFPLCCERGKNCHFRFDNYLLVTKQDMPEIERRWAGETQLALVLKSHEPGREAEKLRALLRKHGFVR